MEIRIVQGVVAVAVLSFGALAYGQTSNAIPSEETFEAMNAGDKILVPGNNNGWYGDTNNTIAIATNISYAWTNALYPVANAAHTKVLKFSDASLTNQFADYNAVNSFTATNMTVDFMIQAVPSEGIPSSNLVAGSQTALYVGTNGLLNVWYGIDSSGNNNAWMTFTNASLGTSDWARVTVALDYTGDAADNGSGDSFFKININGLPLTPTNGGYGPSGFGYANPPGGVFLRTATPTKQVHSFALSGSGMLDDFVITTNAVTNFFQPAGFYMLTVSAGANGTVSPGTTNVLPGSNADFVVTASNYYRIASLTTNGTPVGAFDNNSTATNFTWSNVQANGTLAALFTAQVANNSASTPYWWLAQYGLTNFDADAVADQDHDGLQAWQEYIVATDPTNAASVLKVLSVTSDGVSDTVKWLSATGSPNYNLFYSLNLTNTLNGWTASVNNIVPTPPTNTITIAQPGQPVYYKVTVTN